MSGALRYATAYLLDFFRERVTWEDFEGETIFRVAFIASPSDAIRARIARMFPKAQLIPAEAGRAAVIVIPMTGGSTGLRLRALLGRARHKLLVPSPDYVYRFGMRRGVPALLWAIVDRLLLWPLALAGLVLSILWMYATGLAQAAGRAQSRAGKNPRRLVVVRLTPTRTFVGLLRRLRDQPKRARIVAVLASPEGEAEVAAVADEVLYASTRGFVGAVRALRRFRPDATLLAGGADYGFGPTYLKAAVLARLSGAARRLQWEAGDPTPQPLGAAAREAFARGWRRRWQHNGGALWERASRPARRASYHRLPTRGPRLVQVGLSEACNYHCRMCPFHNPTVDDAVRESERPKMSFQTFARLVSDLRRMGTRELDICGNGEPLTNPEALEMIALARDLGFAVKLATNAGLLTQARARRLVDLGIDRMHVSINAGSDDIYAQMHPGTAPGTMSTIIARLRELAEYAEETGQRPIEVEFSAVLTRLNARQILDMVEAARRARAGWLMLIRMGPVEGQDHLRELLPRPQEWEAIRADIARARELADQYGIRNNLSEWQFGASPEGTRSLYEQIPCYIGSEFSLVLASGAVKFCCHCFPEAGDLGEGGFAAVWKSARYQAMRKQAMALPETKQSLPHCGCFDSCSHIGENLAVHTRLYGTAAARGRSLS